MQVPTTDLAKRSDANSQVQRKESRARSQAGNGAQLKVGVGLAGEIWDQDKPSGTTGESAAWVTESGFLLRPEVP